MNEVFSTDSATLIGEQKSLFQLDLVAQDDAGQDADCPFMCMQSLADEDSE
jgi:hypothetical protein